MVSKNPPPEMMTTEGRQQLEEKMAHMDDEVNEVEEVDHASSNGVARSAEDMDPEVDGFRYLTVPIFGIKKRICFRSLTARKFESIAKEDEKNILLYSVCDGDGRLFLEPERLSELIDGYDARTYAEMLSAANLHCLGRGGLQDMVEESAGN